MGVKLSDLITQLTAWYARRDNPNQVTAAQADTNTKAEMDAKIAEMTPKGVLPIAYFGDCTDIRTATIPITVNGLVITYPETPVMLAGTDYVLAAGSVDLNAITGMWANRTGYLFITRTGGHLKWTYEPWGGTESGESLRVGTITTNGNVITSAKFDKVFLLGFQRMMG